MDRHRSAFDPRAHKEATKDAPKWTDLSPDQQAEFIANLRRQSSDVVTQTNRDSRSAPQDINFSFEEFQSLAQKAGFTLVAIGDKPPSDDGYAINREARIKELEAQAVTLRQRAVTAEAIAATAVRELNELKAAKEQPSES